MASQLYGYLEEFNPAADSIKAYLERVSLYFAAYGVEDAKKVPILTTKLYWSFYALLSDLLPPATPGEKKIL